MIIIAIFIAMNIVMIPINFAHSIAIKISPKEFEYYCRWILGWIKLQIKKKEAGVAIEKKLKIND